MYPCKRCGCCCRHAGETVLGRAIARPDGVCRYLDERTNRCTIYDRRPIFCRVDEGYEVYFKDRMSREEYYRKNLEMCRLLRGEVLPVPQKEKGEKL